MITLNVYNQQGDAVGTVQIDPAEFGGRVNKQLLHEVVLMHLANRRRGTHSTKRRGEVEGSTRKLYRQKGTGRARVGSRRTNKRVGGGTAKGPARRLTRMAPECWCARSPRPRAASSAAPANARTPPRRLPPRGQRDEGPRGGTDVLRERTDEAVVVVLFDDVC